MLQLYKRRRLKDRERLGRLPIPFSWDIGRVIALFLVIPGFRTVRLVHDLASGLIGSVRTAPLYTLSFPLC
ncbi:hypothetical protein BJX99DRAFT_238193 [Aspergillus californicus]